MKYKLFTAVFILITLLLFSFEKDKAPTITTFQHATYLKYYDSSINQLFQQIDVCISAKNTTEKKWKEQITHTRISLKKLDFWLRYLDPNAYRLLNAPLPVEYETEVFEKYEKPYRREGSGLTLAALALEEGDTIQTLTMLTRMKAAKTSYLSDSIHNILQNPAHFFFANRLYLLNLASIYTTGFDGPDPKNVLPELLAMLTYTKQIYEVYNLSAKQDYSLHQAYLEVYDSLIQFVKQQGENFTTFDHYTFIKDYVNPLFSLNQTYIQNNGFRSKSVVDYSLNSKATSLFQKNIYEAQNDRGIFRKISDQAVLDELKELGRMLFYDPIMSENNQRSCASCHNPTYGFAQNKAKPLAYDGKTELPRNAPTLLNANDQHLIMYDGKHISLQQQAGAVILHPDEMHGNTEDILKKVTSCKDYKTRLKKLIKLTPAYPTISLEHIQSAMVYYYTSFSNFQAPFDEMMESKLPTDKFVAEGFNLFMGKAKCATCHFVPKFNGVKPPFVGSEFEVLGLPTSPESKQLDTDLGRAVILDVPEMKNAFRTSSLRNLALTAPYMHNGSYENLNQVIDFYDKGGGLGLGIQVNNQTLPSEPLELTTIEKERLVAFLKSLNEPIPSVKLPTSLPRSTKRQLNKRDIHNIY